MTFGKTAKITGATLLLLVLLGLTVFGAIKLTNQQTKQGQPLACPAIGADHTIVIKQNKPAPDHVTAPRCDRLTITNEDSLTRLVAFGPHEHHVPYDGVADRLLSQGQSLTVTLNQTGNFRFHDHLHDEVQGTFTVTAH